MGVPRKITVTGAGGFLGRNLLDRLLRSGPIEIVAITGKSRLALIPNWQPNVNSSKIAVVAPNDWDQIDREISDSDILINCAFPRNVDGVGMARGLRFIDRLFECAGMNGDCAVINISSQSVYDQNDPKPATEEDELCLGSCYAVGKYAAELLLASHCSRNRHTNIRLASLIGPDFNQRVVNKLIVNALQNKELSIRDNGSKYGYLDVRDAAAGIDIIACANQEKWDEVYNLGSAKAYTLMEIVEEVKTAFMQNGLLCNIVKKESVIDNPIYSQINSSRFREQYDWKQKYTLKDSVDRILQNYIKQRTIK